MRDNRKDNNRQESSASKEQGTALYLRDIVVYVSVILLVFIVLFRVIVVSGDSMYSTLLDGDYLLLKTNLFYRNPSAGDIVVICKDSYDNGTPIVKRIIATEGQIVDIDFENGIVFVDGFPLDEPYTYTPTNLDEGQAFPQIVEKNCVFVLGDNRNGSKDSRSPQIGQIDKREILGKALFIFFPGTDEGMSPRNFDRIGAVK